MGFGLPWALAGLVAIAIPILAHLLRRQKLPKQTLPTIAFLHRIHATRAARLRVVDMLFFAVQHDEHHLARVTELARER